MACVHLHLHLHFYRLLLHVSLTYHFFRIYMIPDAISRRAGTSHEKERSKEVFIKNPDAVSRFGNLIANEISVRSLLGSGTLMSSRCVRDSLYIYYQTSSLLFIDGFCTPVSLVLQDRKDKSFLFNVVDTPGKKKCLVPPIEFSLDLICLTTGPRCSRNTPYSVASRPTLFARRLASRHDDNGP